MNNVEDKIKEHLNYLNHFWAHGIGNKVCNKEGELKTIEETFGELGEQVKLKNENKICYIQDLEWVPNEKDFENILKRLGAQINKDSVIYRRVIYDLPKTLEQVEFIIREIRLLAYNSGIEIFTNYFTK